MSSPVRILYLGLPLGALHLARHGFVPAAVAVGHPDAPGMRRLRRRLGPRGVLLLGRPDLASPQVQATLRAARPDALLSFFWPRRVPREVLEGVPLGAFGTHPSLLPRWRGPDPYFWAIRSGDAVTGVTLHRLSADYDTGAIVDRRVVPVGEADAWRLARRLDGPALDLLVQCAERLSAGERLQGTPQDPALATPAPAPRDADLEIDWRRPDAEIVRLVRAAAPHPGAHTRIGHTPVTVLEARPTGDPPPAALQPAEAWQTSGGLAVRAGRGAVHLIRVRTAAGRMVDPATLLEPDAPDQG
ncbi:MAG: methionyl-tRNA formyltransferase [Myxococcota bacterium]